MELILPLATCHCTSHCVMILLFIILANKFSLSLSLSLSLSGYVGVLAGSNPGLFAIECSPGQIVITHVPLSPSSIIWYQGGDALWLGR